MYILERGDDFVVVNKPAGFATHQVDAGVPGLQEALIQELSLNLPDGRRVPDLYVVHRLDKTTTGVMIFATTKEKARQISELFLQHKAQKRYLFLTRSTPALEKDSGDFRVHKSPIRGEPAVTEFRRIKLNSLFQLWEARPLTGRTHQIRIHASELKMPILGDAEYGGASYPHLCLHAEKLELPGVGSWSCPPPPFFERMGLIRDAELGLILSAADRRERQFNFLKNPAQSVRISHLESEKFRIDLFGSVFWVYWYHTEAPTPADLERFAFAAHFLGRKLVLRKMENRGKSPLLSQAQTLTEIEGPWIFQEGDLFFEGRTDSGLSPGLFLDQRNNRTWVRKQARGARVLNLFAYTCGFSVAAAKGAAKSVTSVDVSKNFLEWGKRNFTLNSLDPAKAQFFATDSVSFIEKALKRKSQWDLIILDPPSFSRSSDGVWKIDRDLAPFVEKCFSVLAPHGKILCSTNFEGWTPGRMREKLTTYLQKSSKANFHFSKPAPQAWDFELPKQEVLMKNWVLTQTQKKKGGSDGHL
jgi:23S rRNA (cytosine1962-C5)-methyltransferase